MHGTRRKVPRKDPASKVGEPTGESRIASRKVSVRSSASSTTPSWGLSHCFHLEREFPCPGVLLIGEFGFCLDRFSICQRICFPKGHLWEHRPLGFSGFHPNGKVKTTTATVRYFGAMVGIPPKTSAVYYSPPAPGNKKKEAPSTCHLLLDQWYFRSLGRFSVFRVGAHGRGGGFDREPIEIRGSAGTPGSSGMRSNEPGSLRAWRKWKGLGCQ